MTIVRAYVTPKHLLAGGILMLIGLLAPLSVYAADAAPAGEPLFAHRGLYAPGHFGNSYEAMGEREMRAILEEAVYWGFNRYGDWFDTIDCSDPFVDPLYNMGGALWDRKKANFRSAQAAGLKCDLIITPNHVYVDQCRPDLLAKKGKRVFGQLICPSKPEAHAIILRNYENLFADLAKAGVHLAGLWPCLYDYGGCTCEACQPWILTFAKLCKEIDAIALEHHPGIEMHFLGWWWSDEEHRQFAEWAEAEAPGWARSIAMYVPYGETDVSDEKLPADCERRAFIHNGYADTASPRDIYGHLGPVIAPERLPQTLTTLKGHGVTGFMAYSEGNYEDVNRAILAGISSGRFAAVDEVLRAYAQRYFHADGESAAAWAAWLKQWGRPYEVDTAQARAEFERLCEGMPRDDWRVRQWDLKIELFRRHAAIMSEETWTEARLANAEAFWATREKLEREVYGLGVIRHGLAKPYTPVPWMKSWSDYVAQHAEEMAADM